MKNTITPTPRPYTDPRRPSISHIVEHREGTKRRRKFFSSIDDARSYCKGVTKKQRQLGFDDAALLSAEAAREAVEALKRLKPTGKTLTEAVDHFLRWEAAAAISRPTGEAVDAWLQSVEEAVERGELKERTAQHYQRVKAFRDYFAGRPLATITKAELVKWLNRIKGVGLTRNHYRAVCSTFYSWAIAEGITTENIPLQTPKARQATDSGEPIRAKSLKLAFDLATGAKAGANLTATQQRELTAWLAMGAFAGLRASEIFRARWEHLKFDKGEIHVPVAKSKQPRRVPMTAAARAWLATVAATEGAIITHKHFENNGALKVLRAAMREHGEAWPKNGLRKCFATCYYLLEAGQDAQKTCIATGHANQSTFEGFYLGGFDEEEAKKVWAIRPRTKRGKIVKFA